MKIDTIIFDLDGTLLNSLNDLHVCFNHAIKSFGYPERTLSEIKSFVGNGIKKAIERALPNPIEDSDLNKIVDYFRIYYKDHMAEFTKPYDGIISMLKELKNKGYKLAVVSNKYDDEVKKLVQNYFGEYIDVAIGEGHGIRRKPEVDGVIEAINELHSNLRKAIFVGDSDVDIKTAQNAGIHCISVTWGFRDRDFLMREGAEYFANHPKEIVEIIEKKIYLG